VLIAMFIALPRCEPADQGPACLRVNGPGAEILTSLVQRARLRARKSIVSERACARKSLASERACARKSLASERACARKSLASERACARKSLVSERACARKSLVSARKSSPYAPLLWPIGHLENNRAAKANVPREPMGVRGDAPDDRRDFSSAAVIAPWTHVALAMSVRNRIWSNWVEHHRPASQPASVGPDRTAARNRPRGRRSA
jgi:hypothetical protein